MEPIARCKRGVDIVSYGHASGVAEGFVDCGEHQSFRAFLPQYAIITCTANETNTGGVPACG